MKNKDKKNLLQFIVITAFALFILGNFFPIMSMSSSDIPDDIISDKQKKNEYWGSNTYLTLNHFYYRNDKIAQLTNKSCLFDNYIILYIYELTPEDVNIDVYNFLSEQNELGLGKFDGTIYSFLVIPIVVMLIISIYFGLISIKNIHKKYSKASLYAGVFLMIPVVLVVLGNIYVHTVDVYPPLSLYLRYHLGLLYFVLSIILYIISFFLQKNVVYEEKKEEVLQEKGEIGSGG